MLPDTQSEVPRLAGLARSTNVRYVRITYDRFGAGTGSHPADLKLRVTMLERANSRLRPGSDAGAARKRTVT
jgi:hypothetical protein